jgi:hypothetical protein
VSASFDIAGVMLEAVRENEAVPSRDPVILGEYKEFNAASDPDTMTFFHAGILYSYHCG